MEYYEKSLKLVKFMLGFVVFSVIFVNFIKPKFDESIDEQQKQIYEQQKMLEKLRQRADAAQNTGETRKRSPENIKYESPNTFQTREEKNQQ